MGGTGHDEARFRLDRVVGLVRVVEDDAQHRGRHAGEGNVLLLDQPVDLAADHGTQHHVRRTHRRERERPAPAVGVEHGQRPQLNIVVANAQVGDEIVGVDVAVAMGEHHTLRARRGARGVVDRSDVVLVLIDRRRAGAGLRRDQLVPVPPAGRGLRTCRRIGYDPVLHLGEAGAHFVHELRVLVVHEHRLHARVVDDVFVVGGDQPVVERHQDRADLRHGVEALQKVVRVRAEDTDPVALLHAQLEQGMTELVAPFLELRVGDAFVTVDDGRLVRVELGCTAEEIADQQGNFHVAPRAVLSIWSLAVTAHSTVKARKRCADSRRGVPYPGNARLLGGRSRGRSSRWPSTARSFTSASAGSAA